MSAPHGPQQKKGLSVFAIAGMGCLGLLVLLFLGGGIIVAKFMPQIKEMAAEYEKDPALFAIRILEMNPDIEVIKKDDAKREITFKTKSTGETVTITYDDLASGKMNMKKEKGEEYSNDTSKTQTENVVMKDTDGQVVTRGVAAASTPPAEVPLYPGLALQDGGYRMDQPEAISGMAVGSVKAEVGKIKEHYETTLQAAGFEVTTMANGNNLAATITGKKADGKSSISVMITPEPGVPDNIQVTTQYHLVKP